MNDTATIALVFTAPRGKATIGRIHRATCKHIPASANPIPAEKASADDVFDATRATCCSPKEADVKAAIAASEAGTTLPPKGPKAAADAKLAARDAAEKAATKPAPKPKAEGAKVRFGSWDATTAAEHKCEGACGTILPAAAFPTTSKPGIRGAECRKDRDARRTA